MNTGELTRALCMALVHSLWQGLLAAVLAGLIIAGTRRSRAAIRYNLLTLDLLLFLLAVGTTFYRELGEGRVLPAALSGRPARSGVVRVLAQLPVHAPVRGLHPVALLGRAGHFLNTHAGVVVLVWMFCLLVQLVRMAGGLYQMSRLRTSRVFGPPHVWGERVKELAARLGITREIELLQSGLVNMPVTFGFLRPSILVPLGILANLPPDQVETILLHELAHIRRNDYVANLVLHLTEAMFFFNPGVRWMAARIREEREACCDDMVLGGVRDRASYLDALVAFREYAARQGRGYAMSLGSGRTDLLWRIRRMLNQENKNLHIMEKAILSLGLTAILAIGLISMRTVDRHKGRQVKTVQAATAATDVQTADLAGDLPADNNTDTVPGTAAIQKAKFPTINTSIEDNGSTKKVKINATDAEGNTFELSRANGEVTSLIINGKTIPKESYDQYMYIFDEIARRSEHRSMNHDGDDELTDEDRRQDALERQQEAMERNMEEVQRQQEEAQAKAERALEEAQAKAEHDQEETQAKLEKAQEEQERVMEQQQEELQKKQDLQTKLESMIDEESTDERSINAIIDDLIDAGLVGSKAEVKGFTLDNNGLVLNGVKQPAEVYKAFKKKYVWKPKDHFIYAHSGGSRTNDVWLEDGKEDEGQ